MSVITRDCPHCHSKNMTFASFGEHEYTMAQMKIFTTAFYCNGCHEGFIGSIHVALGASPINFKGNLSQHQGANFLKEYPKSEPDSIPDYLPSNIENFFNQAIGTCKNKNYDASAMMSRKVLEVSVKKLNPTGEGTLYKRIEQLHQSGLITKDLKDWAHIIRDDGNDATHEETPTTEEHAKELLSFCELFLMYTFTMPGMMNAKRQ